MVILGPRLLNLGTAIFLGQETLAGSSASCQKLTKRATDRENTGACAGVHDLGLEVVNITSAHINLAKTQTFESTDFGWLGIQQAVVPTTSCNVLIVVNHWTDSTIQSLFFFFSLQYKDIKIDKSTVISLSEIYCVLYTVILWMLDSEIVQDLMQIFSSSIG